MPDMTSSAPRRRLPLLAGTVMVGLSLIGYTTVADDFRHVGEFAGVSAFLIGGLALIGDALQIMSRWLALRWVAIGVLLGAVLGTAIDATLVGFAVGLAAGIVLAHLRAQRGEPVLLH